MTKFKLSIPGSLKLLGEYAVLEGYCGMACAIDKRMHFELEPLENSEKIYIYTELDEISFNVSEIPTISHTKLNYLIGVVKLFSTEIKSGFNLTITSEFSDIIGLGSSAAVTAGAVAIFGKYLGFTFTDLDILLKSLEVIRDIQGLASGIDVAASIVGGVVFFKNSPFVIEKLPNSPPITLIYSGSKTRTTDSIKLVQEHMSDIISLKPHIYNLIAECVYLAKQSIIEQNWSTLGKLFTINHNALKNLNVSNKIIDMIVDVLSMSEEITGSKISGSGFGDCIVSIGEAQIDPKVLEKLHPKAHQIITKIDQEGILYE